MNKIKFPFALSVFVFLGLISFKLFSLLPVLAATDTTPIAKGSLNHVLERGTLRVGVSLFTPWVLKNTDGELVGFEVDVATQLAKDLGVQLELVEFAWNAIIPALLDKKIDIIVSGMVITPQRALQVNFSQPYADSGIGLATNLALTKRFTGLENLNQPDVRIGVVAETVAEDLARRILPKANIQSFQKSEQAVQSLIQAKIHGYVEHNPLPTFLALDHPDKVDEPLSEPLLTTKAGLAVNKGDPDFINFLNAWIIARDADAWLTSAYNYWFKSVRWREEGMKAK